VVPARDSDDRAVADDLGGRRFCARGCESLRRRCRAHRPEEPGREPPRADDRSDGLAARRQGGARRFAEGPRGAAAGVSAGSVANR